MGRRQETEGVVTEALPKCLYRVTCDNGRKVIASLATVTRQVTVQVLPGDRVVVELSARDSSRGRIEKCWR